LRSKVKNIALHIGTSYRNQLHADTQCRGEVPKVLTRFTVTQPLRYPLKPRYRWVSARKGSGRVC